MFIIIFNYFYVNDFVCYYDGYSNCDLEWDYV